MSNDVQDADAIEVLENEAPVYTDDVVDDTVDDGAADESSEEAFAIVDIEVVVDETVPAPIAAEAVEATGVDPDLVIAAFESDEPIVIDITELEVSSDDSGEDVDDDAEPEDN